MSAKNQYTNQLILCTPLLTRAPVWAPRRAVESEPGSESMLAGGSAAMSVHWSATERAQAWAQSLAVALVRWSVPGRAAKKAAALGPE